jgi:nucleoside-diphosphate-sugar epimerase
MVIGSGLLGTAFIDLKSFSNTIFFTSGVSNSKTATALDFDRERNLFVEISKKHPDQLFVYFSTTSIYDDSLINTEYVKHKLKMEELAMKHCKRFLIFRLSNIVGKTKNPNTVFNFFYNSILNEVPFAVWKNATRNFLDVDHVRIIVSYLLQNNSENNIINVANPISISVLELVNQFEKYLGKKAHFELMDKGQSFNVDVSDIFKALQVLNLKFDENYILNLLKKYYPFDI